MRRKSFEANQAIDSEESSVFLSMTPGSKVSAAALIPHACKTGILKKRRNSWLSYCFPFLFKKWNERLVILVGNYLFRFECRESESPKGVPIPIDSVHASYMKVDNNDLVQIRTIRKVYIFKCADKDECVHWINAIIERKNESIKERMGHKKLESSVAQINKHGDSLFEDKLMKEGVNNKNHEVIMNPMYTFKP